MMNTHALSNEEMSRLDKPTSAQSGRTRFAGAKSPGTAALQAMLWKEFRENVQWAVLAMVVVGLLLALEICTRNANYTNPEWIVTTPIFPQITIFMTPVVGLLLGLLQIIPELRRDQWAFLVHRPVEHTALFWGKVLAGLSLYLMATAVPLLIVGIWLFTRTTMIVPFHWQMVAPNLVDILIGVLFYFGAMLTAIRPARWYGSRTLPLAGAVPIAAGIYIVPNVWVAVGCSVLAITIYMLTARANFATFGNYSSQSKASRITLGIVLSCGLLTAGSIAVGLSIATLAVWLEHRTSETPVYGWNEDSYQIDAKGQMVRVMYRRHDGGEFISRVTDLQGKVLYDSHTGKDVYDFPGQKPLLVRLGITPIMESSISLRQHRDAELTPKPYRALLGNVESLGDDGEDGRYTGMNLRWFYSHYDRRIIVYSQRAHRVIGYMGPSGFYAAGANVSPQQARFPGRLLEFVMPWWFMDGLYKVSLNPNNMSVSRLEVQQPGETIQDISYVTAAHVRNSNAPSFLVVLTDRAIKVLQGHGQISVARQNYQSLFSMPLEHDLKTHGSITVTAAPKGARFFIWYRPSITQVHQAVYEPHREIHQATLPNYVVEVSRTGTVLNRYTMPPLPHSIDVGIGEGALFRNRLLAIVFGCTAPAPLAYYSTQLNLLTYSDGAYIAPQEQGAIELLGLICNLLSSLVCAALAYFVARRCAFTRGGYWAWITGVFLLGPLGLCLLLAMRGWPGRVRCPACNKRRDVNREFCEHCGASLPEPQRDGTEIFELAWSG